MAGTVQIGGRSFTVPHRQEPGGLGRSKRVFLAQKALAAAPPEEKADSMADLVRCYFVEDVSRDEMLALLPFDCADIVRACIVASGGTVAEPEPGEAKAP